MATLRLQILRLLLRDESLRGRAWGGDPRRRTGSLMPLPRVCAGQRRGGGRGGDLREEALSPWRAASDSPAMPHNSIRSGKDAEWPGAPSPRVACSPACARVGGAGERTLGLAGSLAWGRSWGRLGPGSPRWPPRRSQALRYPPPGGSAPPKAGFLRTAWSSEGLSVRSEGWPSRPTRVWPCPSE